jgi:lysophospholipase L1-like esterase
MKLNLFTLALLLGLVSNHSWAAEAPATPPARLVLVGDSTMCNYPESSPRRGWGMFIQDYFNSNQLQVINLALSGRSTKTFINQGHWAAALKAKPDYVLIQFGHNDSHAPEKPEATDANTDYRQYLRQYIDEARAVGARVVMITPMCRRVFDADSHIKNDLLAYAEAMKAVAKEKNVPVVDLNRSSVELCNQLGPEASKTLANEAKDQTHFNAKGAKEMARLVMSELLTAEPTLKPAAR